MKVLKYRRMKEENHGTEEHPDIQQIFDPITLGWNESSEELAKREAYNGEYTIEDDGQPEPEPTEQEQLRADVDFLLAMGGVL